MFRKFRVASSLARLLRKLCPPTQIIEGYFSTDVRRESYVRIDAGSCELVLIQREGGTETVERTEVAISQGEMLLEVCQNKVVYERSRFPMRPNVVFVDRFSHPEQVDLITVEFDTPDDADLFFPPVWFGPEIANDVDISPRSIAQGTLRDFGDVEINNRALNALLDEIEVYMRRAGKA